MNVGNVASQVATYSLSKSMDISKEQMEALLAGAQQVSQAPASQKMVNMVNRAVENGHVNILA